MGFLWGVGAFLLALIPLVIIHEFGHFIAAKLCGITVLEFGIGFPPRAKILFKKGDTIYTLNWLPIGGFVRPYGEDFVKPKTEDEMATDHAEIIERGIKNPKSVNQATPLQRIFFMAAGPGINLIAALVLLIFIPLVGDPRYRADVHVYEVTAGSPAEQAGLQREDVILQLDGEKVESADDFNNQIADLEGQPVTLLIARDGEEQEVAFTVERVESETEERAIVNDLMEDMPAQAAGIEIEDVIIRIDDIEMLSVEQLQEYVRDHEDVEMQVTVLRRVGEGNEVQEITIPVTPKEKEGEVLMGITITGVRPAVIGLVAINENIERYTVTLPPGEAINAGWSDFKSVFAVLADFVDDAVHLRLSWREARPVSVVGIGQIGGPQLKQSVDDNAMWPIVSFAAMISIALAVTNLLPIPGLDGGRILLVLVEMIRGKPLPPEREGLIHFIGLLFLLALMAVTLINDIINPIDLGGLR